jgi:hypothetical protein
MPSQGGNVQFLHVVELASLAITNAARYNFCSDLWSLADAAETALWRDDQPGHSLPMQGDRDEARGLALQATWRQVDRADLSRGSSAGARHARARARGNPLVSIIVTADAFLPLNAAGDVPHDWQAAGETNQVTRDTVLMAPADLAASLVDKGQARLGA